VDIFNSEEWRQVLASQFCEKFKIGKRFIFEALIHLTNNMFAGQKLRYEVCWAAAGPSRDIRMVSPCRLICICSNLG
jgi:hypothetical protein